MHMVYWFGTKIENFLFYGYNIITSWDLISTCLGLAALAILYEAMKILQVKLHEIAEVNNQESNQTQNTDISSLLSRVSERSVGVFGLINCHAWVKWFLEIFHRSIHVALGYFLMLAVMTFNGYISIALIIGSGIGYYVFGNILIELNMIKLNKQRKILQCNPECADAVINTSRRQSASSIISENSDAEINVNIKLNVDVHTKSET